MKAKAGVIKDNVLQKLIQNGFNIHTVSGYNMEFHTNKGKSDDIMVRYASHRYYIHTYTTRKFLDKTFTRLEVEFFLQWRKARERKTKRNQS